MKNEPPHDPVPLCVDLDGTLIKTDLLWESVVHLLHHRPLELFLLPWWLLRGGRAYLKHQIAQHTHVDVSALPFNDAFVQYLQAEKKSGRQLILATAADRELSLHVCQATGFFSDVLASYGKKNLRGRAKQETLTARFGTHQFDYAGNSTADLPVWQHARHAIVVNARRHLATRAAQLTVVAGTFLATGSRLKALARALRPHQWLKNLILFVPLLSSHQLTQWTLLCKALVGFISLSLAASAIYVLNDLLDLDADRHHVTKRQRPFAAGDLPLWVGLLITPAFITASFALGTLLPGEFLVVLACYVACAAGYSYWLKKIVLLDAFTLAGLYTLRLVAGQAATGIICSHWLLMFSMFIFLSLGLVKRFQELRSIRQLNQAQIFGRGYLALDLELVASLGSGSGYLAVLVLALYANSPEALVLYRRPELLLLICPLLLYWISRIWMIAHRGQMHEDPVVFALRDRVSYLIGTLALGVLWFAAGH
jgi:4-hydroxybenzoate polyprenyltransferase